MSDAARAVTRLGPTRAAAGLGAFVAALGLASLFIGSYSVPIGDLFAALAGRGDPAHRMLVLELRLPRLLFALELGAGLAVAGAVMQGVLRNDLATPGLLGVHVGGRAAVVVTVALAGGLLPTLALPAASVVGGGATLALVLTLARRGGTLEPQRVILVGLAVSMEIGSVVSVAAMVLPIESFDFLAAWTSGSLERAEPTLLWVLLPWLLVLIPLLWSQSDRLDAIALGDELATGLGVPLQRTRLVLLLGATALSAACVAVEGGGIMFCGLIAPHIARRLVGPAHRRLIPVAMIVGMALILTADTLARLMPGRELPAGTLVTLIGGPYFLWLMIKR